MTYLSEDLNALIWQVESGVDEAVSDAPINRYEVSATEKLVQKVKNPKASINTPDIINKERPTLNTLELASACNDLDALKNIINQLDVPEWREGVRNTVFAKGNPKASIFVIGEEPTRDEDQEGLPFVGEVGSLFDKMFAAVHLTHDAENPDHELYSATSLPWNISQNRAPSMEYIKAMQPFLQRHIELVAPKIIVLMGETPCRMLLNKQGVLRLRGNWHEWSGIPVLTMLHPKSIINDPNKKRDSWEDLKQLKARIESLS